MNLIEHIYNEMSTDDENTDKESERIISLYKAADTATKSAIDDIFSSLCGWYLATLIEKADK